jgi:carboxypeptidase D
VIDTTDLAAIATWEVLQAFLTALPTLDSEIKSRDFNMWTESYGGHYGPAFYNHFYNKNQLIANGTESGVQLNFNTLGIGNGIIDEAIQAEWYPEFAVNNTYGIKAVNDTVYSYMKFANFMVGGCLDQIGYCRDTNMTTPSEKALCSEAQNMCRDNVEGPYYEYGGRGTYDIRHPQADPTPPGYFIDFLNKASTQNSLGVDLNYTTDSNDQVYYAFQSTGDFIYETFIGDLEEVLDHGVRVTLYYGDADYICNWFGGQAISLAVNYTHSEEFRKAEYAPFKVDGIEYGEVREYGNFSFIRIYESGHEVPYYQPVASLEMFRRAIMGENFGNGAPVTPTFETHGNANATHTEPYVALPSSTASSASGTSPTVSPTSSSGVRPIIPRGASRNAYV